MAERQSLERFLQAALVDPDLDVTDAAVERLGTFDLSLLEKLPEAEREAVIGAFVAGMPPRIGPPEAPPVPGETGPMRSLRRIDGGDMANGAASLKRMLDARGLDTMSPTARALFVQCHCWPF